MTIKIRSNNNNNSENAVCIYGNLKCYTKVWAIEKDTIHAGAQLKGKFIAYVRTLWQLENYIQNKSNFIKVVIVPKLWSPNHVLEVIFWMPEAVLSLWELHSCQILGRVLQSLPLVFTEISGILAALRTAGKSLIMTAGKKGLWWTPPLFCNLNLGRFVLILEGCLFVGKTAISSTNTSMIFCKCPWAMHLFCRKI